MCFQIIYYVFKSSITFLKQLLQLNYFSVFYLSIIILNSTFAAVNILYIWANFGQIYQDLIIRFALSKRIYIA